MHPGFLIALRLANFSRAANGETFSLFWASIAGKTYQVETSQSLLNHQWSNIGAPVTATATTSALTVPLAPADERRFLSCECSAVRRRMIEDPPVVWDTLFERMQPVHSRC